MLPLLPPLALRPGSAWQLLLRLLLGLESEGSADVDVPVAARRQTMAAAALLKAAPTISATGRRQGHQITDFPGGVQSHSFGYQ